MRDLSLHILDIAMNSVRAGATEIMISMCCKDMELELEIRDNGAGMDPELLEKADDPFTTTRTTRDIGLGLPLLKHSAETAGGTFGISSQKGAGTAVKATFNNDSIDRVPLGEIGASFSQLSAAKPETRFVLKLESSKGSLETDSFAISAIVGLELMDSEEVRRWMKEYADEGVKKVFGGILNEIDG